MKQILLMIAAVALVGCGVPGTYMHEAALEEKAYKNRLMEIDEAFKRGDITESERQSLKNDAFRVRHQ
jgi:hypothetical protein